MLHAPGSSWTLSSAKTNFQREAFYYSWPLIPQCSRVYVRCWPLWLPGECFRERIAELQNFFLPCKPDLVFLPGLSSFSQVYILPSHFHKVFPVWLSFKVAGEEVMKTRVVNWLQFKAVLFWSWHLKAINCGWVTACTNQPVMDKIHTHDGRWDFV